ncbi:cytochrome P450 [Myceligenerans crystallogenes]|uniref:Cytochrome P450 n=1 Tax=Myceligenerans crystallogenes TaxID=316335 RepID=A0ABP4ZAM6_9MICO
MATVQGSLIPDLTSVDLMDPRTFVEHEPRDFWREARKAGPVYWHPAREGREGFWVLTRHADIQKAYRGVRQFLSGRGTVLDVVVRGDDPAGGKMMAVSDGATHRRLRSVQHSALTPKVLEPVVRDVNERADRLVAEAVGAGEFDFAAGIAEHIPLATICDLLSIPEADRPKLLGWNKLVLSAEEAGTDHIEALAARNELVMYLADLVLERQENPGDDMVSMLATTPVDGRPLTVEEAALNCYSLILGGDETSRMSAIVAVKALAEHPEQLALLRDGADPEIAANEMFRWATPAMHFARRAADDVEFAGETIRKGEIISLWNTSANDDEDVFENPGTLDVTRHPNPHLALGFGPHYCVGAYLGTAEMSAVLSAVARHVGSIEVCAEPARVYSSFLYGYSSLRVRFHP